MLVSFHKNVMISECVGKSKTIYYIYTTFVNAIKTPMNNAVKFSQNILL